MFNNLLKLNRFIFRAVFMPIKKGKGKKRKLYKREIALNIS